MTQMLTLQKGLWCLSKGVRLQERKRLLQDKLLFLNSQSWFTLIAFERISRNEILAIMFGFIVISNRKLLFIG